MNYPLLSVAAVHAGLSSRLFSAKELADEAFRTIEELDKDIHAFIELCPELAYDAAARIDDDLAAGASMPRLAGVPIAYKDNMNLLGTRTTCASRMLEDYRPPFEASCVTKTLQAGALPLGKLNLDEFTFGSSTETSCFGSTHNPWDLERVPGGSSGGSAAAVAAGLTTVALGSDTGGSIRQPAAFCGVVGFKPSYGVISRYGVIGFGSSLDQAGALGRSVADVAATIDAMSGRDPLDCISQPCETVFSDSVGRGVKGLRIGIVHSYLEAEGIDPEIRSALTGAIAHLEGLGTEIVDVELPNAKAALNAYCVIGPCEAFSNLSRYDGIRYGYRSQDARNLDELYEQSRAGGFGAEVRRRIMLGSYLLSSGVYEKYCYPAQQVRTLITQDFHSVFEQVDALLTPTTARTAFKIGEVTDPLTMYLSDIFTIPINIAGNGGMNLPVGLGEESGLPVGVQIIGPQLKDENIFRVAAALEACYPDIARVAPAEGRPHGAAPTHAATDDRGRSSLQESESSQDGGAK